MNTLIRQGLLYVCVAAPIVLLGTFVWGIPEKLCDFLARRSTSERDVLATMKLGFGMWVFPLWAFCVSFLLTLFFGLDISSSYRLGLWGLFLLVTPLFFLLSLVFASSIDFFPGFFRLLLLRSFFPRAYDELMSEWKEMAGHLAEKMALADASQSHLAVKDDLDVFFRQEAKCS